ncbi:hypothetical protein KJZ63_03200 [Patescibacteria group bacterium]|nr:hypothetical protein [Patescibacteria group bacterium]
MKFSRFNIHLLTILMVISLLVFDYFGLAGIFEKMLSFLTKPMQVSARSLVLKIEWPFVMAEKSINSARKVQMLEERYSESLAQLTSLKQLEQENQQLKNLLQNSDREDRTVIITSPIVSQVGPTIGVGSNDGVGVGDLVFVSKTLVGRIREVFPEYAEVDLVTQTDFQPIVAVTAEGFKGLIKGDGKRVVFTEVLPEESPAPESRIQTVGQVGVENGLFVGQIGKLLSSASETVKTYQVIQHVDFYAASIVEIYK